MKMTKEKTTYYIVEAQNFASTREGEFYTASSLSAAKRHATRNQFFQNTVLMIYANDVLLARKKDDKKWEDM